MNGMSLAQVLLLIAGFVALNILHMISFLGIEWWNCQIERLFRRFHLGRRADEDDDPRGGFGGFPS